MKGLRIGRRRGRDGDATLSPLELARRPALVEGRWQVPDRFNFTRDVVEALARDPKRRALTFLGADGVIEPRSFLEIAEGASLWATALRERSVTPGDRIALVSGSTVDWLEAILGVWKVGGVVVPCAPTTTASQLERIVSSTDASLVVAERSYEPIIERMGFTPEVHLFDVGAKRSSKDVPTDVPTHDTASRDLAFVVSTSGAGGARKDVAHTHASVFATRVQAEHWLDVGRGDAVWCTTEATSSLTFWNTVAGPWSRGAEIVLQHGDFDVDERLDLLFRLGPSILCQSPAEYRALAEHPKLERFRSPRLRRLVSTGDYLDSELVTVFEERWGMSIADGYGQAETNVVVATLADGAAKPGTMGRAVPGHHVGVIDDQGNELPAGIEGDLAVRGRPPTLFAGYWEQPEETKSAFLGDWYLTGDVAYVDEEGYFTFVGRAEDVITSGGRTFGPYEVERVLEGHAAIAATAVVGARDLQRGGHFVRAFVVPRSAEGGSEQLEAELRQYASQTLPPHQVPREIVFVDELPQVAWKISRHELRERPVGGRPLWEMPPTTEPEARTPAPPPLDDEFSPRIESALPAPEASAPAVSEPPVLPPPEPPPVAPEPVAFVPVAPEPAAEPETLAPTAPEPVSEPEALAPTTPDPIADTEPPQTPVSPEPPPAAPEVVEAPEPTPTAEAVPLPEPEPDTTPPPPAAVEPAPVDPPPAPPTAETYPSAPELPAAPPAEPSPAPLTLREPDTAASADPLAPAQPEAVTPAAAPEPQPEPEPAAPEPEASAPVPAPVDDTPLPDFVVDAPDEVAPVVIPEPEPEPDLSGPLPEYVVEATEETVESSAPRLEPVPPLPPEEEEEEDLGPLPDYVIDPSNPEAKRPDPPPPPPEPRPIFAPRPPDPEPEATPSQAAGLYFPPVTAFPTPRAERDDEPPREKRPPRRRPPAEQPNAKRSTTPAEPGDDTQEASWMQGLSNRLSAYSLSESEQAEAADATDDDIAAKPEDESAD